MKSNKSEYFPINSGSGDLDFRGSGKHNVSKFDHDLYKEDDDIPTVMIRIKRISLPNKGENWKIMEGAKVMEIIEGAKLGIKEREFLRTADGVNFMLRAYKSGWKSFNQFKKELKTIKK